MFRIRREHLLSQVSCKQLTGVSSIALRVVLYATAGRGSAQHSSPGRIYIKALGVTNKARGAEYVLSKRPIPSVTKRIQRKEFLFQKNKKTLCALWALAKVVSGREKRWSLSNCL